MANIEAEYKKALKYLYGMSKFGIKLGLKSTKKLLYLAGNPEKDMKIIHIGGTNGKGSVCSYITKILTEAGYNVGTFTSPHLDCFSERITINNIQIPRKNVISLVKKIKFLTKSMDMQPTFFEIITVMALLYFKEHHVDFVVLEVGMGGRFDATNATNNILSAITNVEKDHTDFLGENIREIAFEKSGIIKKNSICVTTAYNEAIDVIKKQCNKKKTKLVSVIEDNIKIKKYDVSGQIFKFNDYLLKTKILGKKQSVNAILALTISEELKKMGFKIKKQHIINGIQKTKWPGRLDIIKKNPFVILDCAHNHNAMCYLKDDIKKLFDFDRLISIIGIMSNKDKVSMLSEIIPITDIAIFTKPKLKRSENPVILKELSKSDVKKYFIINDVKKAVKKALDISNKKDLILITGSIFTVSEARRYLIKNIKYDELIAM
ncbi:bifunctional folylpolyglutamate synthase/dihydrofolate synthase [Candidatus Aenigmatarchaeota archaeon]